jgi:lipopolysaccharide biosynthesis regulator YciM
VSLAPRVAHYWCELAQAADDRGDADAAERALQQARQAEPTAARPLVLSGRRLARLGRPLAALAAWDELRRCRGAAFALVAAEYADTARACGRVPPARQALLEAAAQDPGIDVLRALARLADEDPRSSRRRLLELLQRHPTLSAVLDVLGGDGHNLDTEALLAVRQAVATAAKPLQRYRCAACGFEAQHWFWQCPGCLSWDSYPPRRIEEQ